MNHHQQEYTMAPIKSIKSSFIPATTFISSLGYQSSCVSRFGASVYRTVFVRKTTPFIGSYSISGIEIRQYHASSIRQVR